MVYRRETQRLRASGPQQAVDLYVHRWQQPIRGVPAPRACGTLALGHALPSRSQTKQPAEVHNERELRRTALGDDLDHPTHRRETMAVKNYVESDTNPSPVTAAIAAILSILIFGGIIAALILFAIHH